MQRRDIYQTILSAFTEAYSFLGEQFATEFLLSAASWPLQTFSKPQFRIRRHLMLCWEAAYLKSHLLNQAYGILGKELCSHLTDISIAALRGTVEGNEFVSPYTLKRPFAVCTEFGQLSGGWEQTEVVQKLLNILEEGLIEVSLGKIAYLSKDKKEQAKADWGIYFIDNNTFAYNTNWVLMAATYNKKFLADNALESRFNIVYPHKPLDNELTKHVVSHSFFLDEEVKIAFRKEILKPDTYSCNVKLPDAAFEVGRLTPRDCGALKSTVLCREWWGFNTSDDEIVDMAFNIIKDRVQVWSSAEDRVFDSIENEPKTVAEISKDTGISKKHIYNCLHKLRAYRKPLYDEEGNAIMKWSL